MRKLLLFIFAVSLYAVPGWYYHLDPQTSNSYVGYGQGKSETEAKNAALSDISRQISVTVDSRLSSRTSVKDDILSEDFDADDRQTSYAKIYGYETLELEYQEGQYYAALGYENIPSIEKFNKKLSAITLDRPEVHNPYLKQTTIYKELDKKVDFSLKRQDSIWYIRYKKIFQALDERDFSHFFITTTNPDLSIMTNKRNDLLYDGDEFYFKVTSKKDGYITIFTAYEDGTVATLIRNVPIQRAKTENIPDKDLKSVLQAGLIKKGMKTFELYVMVYSKERQHFDNFARADEDLVDDERYKNFDELINLLDDVEFVTLKVVTKPR